MLAWRVHSHDSPPRLEEVPDPAPGPGEARVRVRAVGLNHLDLWVARGVPGHRFPLPMIPGCDVVGTVESYGPGTAPSVPLGERVLVAPGISCGTCEACRADLDPLCREFGIPGETRDGGCAEFLVIPATNLVPLPPSIPDAEAAAIGIPFLTAWTMLARKAGLRAGETALIHAGGSGVSVAAIQIAKLLGARVITTVGSAEKAARARAIGADETILYRETPFRDEVRRLLKTAGKRGCEVVVDHVGSETFADSLRCLDRGGRLVTCGATSGAEVTIDLKPVFFKSLSILGSTMGSARDLRHVVGLVAAGKLRPIVHAALPMAELPRAHALLASRAAFGKIVLTR